ncbi:Glycosyltransferase involved in cell wall bisynthesis [Ekhidna lutea]|uniref:Glycosyltransferase involved in cell wall bisynthesis n=1 Tax=Ekhidna lutea TaxID=447679 RepID=A0A239J8B4_EKHLU|nr:glycosyltransferase family 4 protein [Ekhidna lutea]SNT01748.1 Glycosyltransferase involved in cell wall bisynthesis [Ekhidna lutea]
MPRILFLTLHRKERSPGQRFRHEQYLAFLEQNGFDVTYSPMLNQKQDKVFYGAGNVFGKVFVGLSALLTRIKDLLRAHKFDYIFIYRDAFFFGTFFEWLLKKSNAKLIFDFDDSIWLQDENPNQTFFQKLKNPSKTGKIISYCDLTIAGNQYLADYAKQHTSNVTIIPTTIDLKEYQRMEVSKDSNKVCIGWSGSFSTIKHFESALEALKVINEKYKDKIYFKVIGDGNYTNKELNINGLPWKAKTEVSDLCEIDIGIMPLPDDEWSKGKCGLKGLQYMALEIPAIMSPVGVNSDIIVDGENGFLAGSTEEWIEKLSLLIEDEQLRKKMGKAGRKTVEENYSVDANKEKWLKAFQF